uniref:Uncharacterized protein n=1 Tax=Setaria digitata TaxID=48799 RepID=A0A915PBB8_9BILA
MYRNLLLREIEKKVDPFIIYHLCGRLHALLHAGMRCAAAISCVMNALSQAGSG